MLVPKATYDPRGRAHRSDSKVLYPLRHTSDTWQHPVPQGRLHEPGAGEQANESGLPTPRSPVNALARARPPQQPNATGAAPNTRT